MLIPILVSLLSLFALAWYSLIFKTKRAFNLLLSKGAKAKSELETNPHDDHFGYKKAIQEDPNMKLVVAKMPGKIILSFIDPESTKEVLLNHTNYEKLNKTSELSKLLTSKSVIIVDGYRWKVHRLLISEAFQYSFFDGMIPVIVETTKEVLGFSSKQKKTILFPNTTELITSDVATRTFFGIQSAKTITNGRKAPEELSDIIIKLMKYSVSPLRFFPGMWALNFYKDYRDLKRRIRGFRKVFTEMMISRMQGIRAKNSNKDEDTKKGTDILEILLRYRVKYSDDLDKTLTDEEILDDFFIFCIAGKDTTSALVTMALYCCEKYPEWGKKLKEEVEKTITDTDNIKLDQINSMSFMSAFINEVMRMFPPVPSLLPRIAKHDHKVGEFFVQKGDIVTVSLVASNYNPKFFDDPEKFDPKRWLKTDKRNEEWKTNPFCYVPFSGGPRNCIGKHFALIEARVILSLVLKHFDLHIDPQFQLELGYLGVGYLPKKPIPLTLTPK